MVEKINEKKGLVKFLNSVDGEHTRNIIGKSLLHWHCGTPMVKVQEIQHYYDNGHLKLNPLDGKVLYCIRCGEVKDTYPYQM